MFNNVGVFKNAQYVYNVNAQILSVFPFKTG